MSKITVAGFETAAASRWSGSTAYLRVYYYGSRPDAFSFSTGEVWSPSLENFYREISCTLASSVVTIPTTILDSTPDITNRSDVFCRMVLMDASRSEDSQILLADRWDIPTSLGTTVTFEMLRVHNETPVTRFDDRASLSRTAIEAMMSGLVAVGNPATTSALGRVKMASTPRDAASPKAVDDSDPRLAGGINVLGYPYDAPNDGIADATAELQAAIDAAIHSGAVIIPAGKYKTSAPLVSTRPLLIVGLGPQYNYPASAPSAGRTYGTNIIANFAGYVFDFPMVEIVGGTGVENMRIENTHAAGGCINYSGGGAPSRFAHLDLAAYRGLTIGGGAVTPFNFSALVSDVHCNPAGAAFTAGSWGIYSAGHSTFQNCDIAAYEHGIRLAGTGFSISGGRYEVNKVALVIGMRDDGTDFPAANVDISGFSMEANDTAIWVRDGANYSISCGSIQGSVNSPSGQSELGLNIVYQGRGSVSELAVGGTFSKAGIRSQGGTRFSGITVSPNALGMAWDVRDIAGSTFLNSNFDLKNDGVETPHVVSTQFVRSLGAADQVRGAKQGKNLRGINVAVASGATFLDITFPSLFAGGAAINAATATGSGNTLPTGTYFYIGTLVNEVGETAAVAEKTVAVTLGQKVDITFFGVGGSQKQWRRRIYRGTASGVYDGYFDHTLESNSTFSDTGQSFTGRRSPPLAAGADGTEPDAVYAVSVAPAWSTTTYISNKATTGFRINFGTAPGSYSTLDWILVR